MKTNSESIDCGVWVGGAIYPGNHYIVLSAAAKMAGGLLLLLSLSFNDFFRWQMKAMIDFATSPFPNTQG